MYNLKL